MCQLDWAKGFPDSWSNTTSGCVCEGGQHLKEQTVKGSTLTEVEGIIQANEDLSGTETQRKGKFSLFLIRNIHLLLTTDSGAHGSLVFGLLCTLDLHWHLPYQIPRPLKLNWAIPPALLVLSLPASHGETPQSP